MLYAWKAPTGTVPAHLHMPKYEQIGGEREGLPSLLHLSAVDSHSTQKGTSSMSSRDLWCFGNLMSLLFGDVSLSFYLCLDRFLLVTCFIMLRLSLHASIYLWSTRERAAQSFLSGVSSSLTMWSHRYIISGRCRSYLI